mmetsp:Transcript_54701/g.63947  ORF Transcript_54701/g.63947 Transcript_54701/m.63947 type:complete len:350 (-) Transcript_54701:732-1781(-)
METVSVSSCSEEYVNPAEITLKKLTVVQLKHELEKSGVAKKTYGRLRKAQLIDLLSLERQNNTIENNVKHAEGRYDTQLISGQAFSEKCTILILDEKFQQFPWEGLSFLRERAVCRVPSLPFVVAPLLGNNATPPVVDPRKLSYVVDCESNLSGTKETLQPIINSFSSRPNWDWNGIVGSFPSQEFLIKALTRENSLFLYCGHGGGERCFSRSQIEGLFNPNNSFETSENTKIGCQSTVILMGCSSGKLLCSSDGKEKIGGAPLFYEPDGIATSYLASGSACVIGNLWDVTDKDIDRYCVRLLQLFLGEKSSNKSLAHCVADARGACKMRYIVGCAPVCYGVPVRCMDV